MTSSSLDFQEAQPASFEELRVRDCSIKRTLDVIGEKWTLLVLREAFYGARRFEQFLANVGCAGLPRDGRSHPIGIRRRADSRRRLIHDVSTTAEPRHQRSPRPLSTVSGCACPMHDII